MLQFNEHNFHSLCDDLGSRDKHLQSIINDIGYPPLWTRPNSFETIVLTILEQQVSLASAFAAYKKLREKLIGFTPQKLLSLSDEELRSCYLSRQKIIYVRELASAVATRKIDLVKFETADDHVVRKELKALKGIGDWTVDIYLIHALQRTDVFPIGDLALVNGINMLTGILHTKGELQKLSENWQPFRSIATMLVWHYYIRKKNIKLLH